MLAQENRFQPLSNFSSKVEHNVCDFTLLQHSGLLYCSNFVTVSVSTPWLSFKWQSWSKMRLNFYSSSNVKMPFFVKMVLFIDSLSFIIYFLTIEWSSVTDYLTSTYSCVKHLLLYHSDLHFWYKLLLHFVLHKLLWILLLMHVDDLKIVPSYCQLCHFLVLERMAFPVYCCCTLTGL